MKFQHEIEEPYLMNWTGYHSAFQLKADSACTCCFGAGVGITSAFASAPSFVAPISAGGALIAAAEMHVLGVPIFSDREKGDDCILAEFRRHLRLPTPVK